MKKSFLRLILFLGALGLHIGCEFKDELIEHSLERLNWGGGDEESRRVRDLLIEELKKATTKSLETPALVNASFAFELPESNMTMLELDWIGSPPNANGFILELENGEEMSFSLDPDFVDLSPNEHAICQAVMEIKKPSTGIVSVRLTLNGKPISNICKFYSKN
ncbi:MAG: hypothetical protein HN494_01635 [Opitutae bacterium]|nr:hypothetical protein [Opitutae bacterium]MBT6851936.1 hypothetical protein [Opitutae bacterium]